MKPSAGEGESMKGNKGIFDFNNIMLFEGIPERSLLSYQKVMNRKMFVKS